MDEREGKDWEVRNKRDVLVFQCMGVACVGSVDKECRRCKSHEETKQDMEDEEVRSQGVQHDNEGG